MAGSIKNWTRKVILQKVEVTEGTDSAPVVATDALQVLNYQPQFMDSEGKVRNIEKAYLGANPTLLSGFRRGASFEMEMHGGGIAAGTTVPPWMKALRPAGMDAGVVTGANSVVQKPLSDPISVTHWGYLDDLLLKTIGARASFGFTIEDDDFPRFNMTLLGRAPATLAEQAAPGNPTISGYIDPVLASSENTSFVLDGYAAPLRRWVMSNGADLQFRSLIGPADRVIMRERPFSGTIVIRVPDLTAKDYFSKIRPGTTMAAQAIHGNVAGNIVQIDTPKLQITGNVTIEEEAGEAMATIPVTALPVTGNDEIVLTSK
ncbi:MAG: hypothetical protein H0U52_04635 [Chloroflexi bacterium]|nr:hypothetical protein [Chloroflexota bacterium]